MAKKPTNDKVKRSYLATVNEYNIRPGGFFPKIGVEQKMNDKDYSHEEIHEAFNEMVNDGWIEDSNTPHAKLTDKGFAEM